MGRMGDRTLLGEDAYDDVPGPLCRRAGCVSTTGTPPWPTTASLGGGAVVHPDTCSCFECYTKQVSSVDARLRALREGRSRTCIFSKRLRASAHWPSRRRAQR
jgi:hypothetical protein